MGKARVGFLEILSRNRGIDGLLLDFPFSRLEPTAPSCDDEYFSQVGTIYRLSAEFRQERSRWHLPQLE